MIPFPLLPHVLFLFRRQGTQRFVLFPRRLPLGRGQLKPGAHLLPDALLLFRTHARVALRDPPPLGLALSVELVPFGRERGEELLLGGREAIPGRRPNADRLRKGATGDPGRKRKGRCENVRYSS